jgi:ankyrin repeat protein
MLTSRCIRYPSLIGIALVALIGCGLSPEHCPPAPARGAAAPEVAETPEATAPVMDPAAAARVERVRQSLEQGLDVNKADPDGRTVMMMAAFEGYTEVVEVLLEYGAEVDRRDDAGRTALMYASSGPFPQTVELLIENGADVNRADTTEGWTALMVAAAEGHRPVVEFLLRHGADIALTDQDGDSAIDHARERGQTDIVALLES